MNQNILEFLEKLKKRSDVLGVILFGSYARGNNYPNSDVDLVIILTEGYLRTVEYQNEQAFEIIYTTEKEAFDYWESHKDDAAGLWEVAKILYDKDETVQKLRTKISKILDAGKEPITKLRLEHLVFDTKDSFKYITNIITNDPLSANLILTNKVFTLTELFFDIRQAWIPAPKQRIAKIKEISPKLYSLLEQFYQSQIPLEEKLQIAKRMTPIIFEK